jgi:glycosyltransferase 2 family protein
MEKNTIVSKKNIITAFRIIATIIFFYVLFSKFVSLDEVISQISKIDYPLLSICIIITFFSLIFRTLRWMAILDYYGSLGFKKSMIFYLRGLFYASITPGRIGEFIRGVYYANEKKQLKVNGITTVILERGWDIVIQLVIILSYFIFKDWKLMLLFSLVITPLVYFSGLWAIYQLKSKIKRRVRILKTIRLKKPALDKSVFYQSIYSHLQWYGYVITFMIILKSLDVTDIPIGYLAMAISVTGLSLFIPITINGWGLREGIWVFLLKDICPGSVAVIASIILVLLTTYFLAAIGSLIEIYEIKKDSVK